MDIRHRILDIRPIRHILQVYRRMKWMALWYLGIKVSVRALIRKECDMITQVVAIMKKGALVHPESLTDALGGFCASVFVWM